VTGKDRTLVIIKPDGVERGLVGSLIARFEDKGLRMVGLRLVSLTPQIAGRLYEEHRGKGFYDRLIRYITSGPVVAMMLEGDGATAIARGLIGDTDPKKALPGTIRGDYASSIDKNLIHASDSETSARQEIPLFFSLTNK